MGESRQGIVIDFLRDKNVDEEVINTFVREKVSSAVLLRCIVAVKFLMLYDIRKASDEIVVGELGAASWSWE